MDYSTNYSQHYNTRKSTCICDPWCSWNYRVFLRESASFTICIHTYIHTHTHSRIGNFASNFAKCKSLLRRRFVDEAKHVTRCIIYICMYAYHSALKVCHIDSLNTKKYIPVKYREEITFACSSTAIFIFLRIIHMPIHITIHHRLSQWFDFLRQSSKILWKIMRKLQLDLSRTRMRL